MKTTILSNYVERERHKHEAIRISNDSLAQEAHRAALARRVVRREQTAGAAKQAWQRGNALSLLACGCRLALQSLEAGPQRPEPSPVSDKEQILLAGQEGENRVLAHLDAALDDSWQALIGYQANGGDVDIILVGPNGVFGIEVKYLNARANCDRDTWWNDRFGDKRPIVNGRNYSPSEQLNRNIKTLRNYLRKSHAFDKIQTLVVLSHDRSDLGRIRKPTVDDVLLLREWEIPSWLNKLPEVLSPRANRDIAKSIQDSHTYWEKKRKTRASKASAAKTTKTSSHANIIPLPQQTIEDHARREKERSAERFTAMAMPDFMYLWRSRELSERNRWIWQAGSFNHYTDKPSLLGKRKYRIFG